jgi:ribonuclease Z
MKPTFIHTLVNGPFEDPTLFVRIMREKRALLFDIGEIAGLSPGDMQKVTDVFVSHTHIDHFIGFDTLLRALLRRETPLRVYGPSNMADCIEGRLRGYTWNLIREYPLRINVFSVMGDKIIKSGFQAENYFRRTEDDTSDFEGILLKEPLFTVKAAQLNHQISCLAFSLEEEFHININKAVLSEMGLPVGPWLSELKKTIREHPPAETEFMVSGRVYTLEELDKVVTITKGQKISYVTDVSITDDNIEKAVRLVRGSDTLYCEAYFTGEDMDRALKRFHLTSKIAARIAREAAVKNLVVMHFSPKYRDRAEGPADEAIREFRHPAS